VVVWVVTVGGEVKLVSADKDYFNRVTQIMEQTEIKEIVVTRLEPHPDYEAWL
jgi:hypothetical protein